MIKRKNAIRLVGLIVFALVLSWLSNFLAPTKPKLPGLQDIEAHDYKLVNIETRKFDLNGKLLYALNAKTLMHYPQKDESLLEKPVLVQHSRQGDIIETSADRAILKDDNKTIEMQDNVITTQKTRGGRILARANSEQLTLQLQ